ncbi:hypothetical protein SAMN05660909_05319 [Chitinophaga terrae (ex Kim and Jung 2007)]|uniref:Uncharacterized protein n=2 Tax=Chitinophaga terrae (ex Kim and Jung 2007) TaxID=408074 RepID=A0A1H4GGH5_9BACT|nr:hypothetical protein [Chitinophaga terrae (ex Kim and Jung 2007)]SEB08723.1 hypothetical protein SAMN05660909_05319 [Chitinophaga terrae (ex Kim and Jung 2007)]
MITIYILAICFLLALSFKIKKTNMPEARLLLWYTHLLFACLSALCGLLLLNNWGFRGSNTEGVIFSLYAGTGMMLYGLSKPDTSARYAYLLCFFGFPVLLLVALLLPPSRYIALVFILGFLFTDEVTRHKIDSRFSLEAQSTGLFSYFYDYNIVESKLLLFERKKPDVFRTYSQFRNVHMSKTGKDSVHIQLECSRTTIDTTIALRNSRQSSRK